MKNEFKGTKGKWKIYKTEDEFAIVNKSKDQAICFVPILFDKSEANAQLISFAPEMLEMLKELLLDIDEITIPTSMNSTVFKAEQLIKKATEQ